MAISAIRCLTGIVFYDPVKRPFEAHSDRCERMLETSIHMFITTEQTTFYANVFVTA